VHRAKLREAEQVIAKAMGDNRGTLDREAAYGKLAVATPETKPARHLHGNDV
jgi:hypothetical protein